MSSFRVKFINQRRFQQRKIFNSEPHSARSILIIHQHDSSQLDSISFETRLVYRFKLISLGSGALSPDLRPFKVPKKSLNPSQMAAAWQKTREGFRGMALGVGALFDRCERFSVLQSIIIKKIPQTTPSHSGGLLTPVQIYHDCFIFAAWTPLFAARYNKIWKNDCRKISCKWITRQKGTSSWHFQHSRIREDEWNREFHTHTTGVMNLALKLVIPAPNLSAEATVDVGLHYFGASDRPENFFHNFPFCFRTSRRWNPFLTASAATFHRTHGIPFSFAWSDYLS